MNPDDFEQRLQRVPHRSVPGEWRAEILSKANAAVVDANKQRVGGPSLGTGLNGSSRREEALTASPQRLGKRGYLSLVTSAATRMGRELFWPNPQAWAGLVAVWVVIFALKLSTGNEAHVAGENSFVSPEVIAELRQQRQLFLELVGGEAVREARRPKSFLPRPRSDRRVEVRAV